MIKQYALIGLWLAAQGGFAQAQPMQAGASWVMRPPHHAHHSPAPRPARAWPQAYALPPVVDYVLVETVTPAFTGPVATAAVNNGYVCSMMLAQQRFTRQALTLDEAQKRVQNDCAKQNPNRCAGVAAECAALEF